jgi:cell division protein FtsL
MNEITAGPGSGSFSTFEDLQAEHTQLLRDYHSTGGTAELKSQAVLFINRGRRTGAVLDDEDQRQAAQQILDHWATLLFRMAGESPEATLVDFDPNQLPVLSDADCPYLGLDAFGEDQHERFYGRERLLSQCANVLAEHSLLAVIGQSGSGKSSLVSGGLLPALKRNEFSQFPTSSSWTYLGPIVPGANPSQSLANALSESDPNLARTSPANEALGQDSSPLLDGFPHDQSVVVIIDQFEEVFTLCDNEEARDSFLKALVDFAQPAGTLHRIIITMRSEFETWMARNAPLYSLFAAGQLRMVPMSQEELREAIEKPAAAVGLKFEHGVVDSLLRDTLGEPAALPMLQFALLKLWETRRHNRITLAAYEDLGGARLALANSANDFFNKLVPENQETARRILLRMVRVGDGLEVHSQRIKLSAIYETGEDPNRIKFVISELINAHLVRVTASDTPAAQIEVAHEALIRNWPTLLEWIQRKRTDLLTRRRLNEYASEWIRRNRAEAGLLDNELRREAERWIKSDAAREFGFHEALPSLIDASQKQQQAEGERKAREVEKKHKRRRALTFALLVASGSLLVGAILVNANVQRLKEQITRQRTEVESKQREIDELSKRQAVMVEYEASDNEVSDISRILKRARFLATRTQPAAHDPPINTLYYGEKVQLDDVRTLAIDLLDAGIGLRRIEGLKGKRAPEALIQLVGSTTALRDSILRTSEVENYVASVPDNRSVSVPTSTKGARILLFASDAQLGANASIVVKTLSEVGYVIPSRSVIAPKELLDASEVRFFRVNDRTEANFVARLLAPFDRNIQSHYSNDPENARKGIAFEVWFGRNAFVDNPGTQLSWIPRIFIHAGPIDSAVSKKLQSELQEGGSWSTVVETQQPRAVVEVQYSNTCPDDEKEATLLLEKLRQMTSSPVAKSPTPVTMESQPRRLDVYLP